MRHHQLTVYPDGAITSGILQDQYTSSENPNGKQIGGHRGDIKEFTPAAQSRFKKAWRSLDWEPYLEVIRDSPSGRSFLLTLNLPSGHDYTGKEFARIRSRFSTALSRQFRQNFQGGIWKAELQRDATLHWHLVIFLGERQQTSELWELIRDLWTSITKSQKPSFRRTGVHVQACYHGDKRTLCGDLLHYLSKHPAVYKGLEWHHGAIWGQLQVKRLPKASIVTIRHDSGESDLHNRLMIEALKAHPVASKLTKVQKLSIRWRGWTVLLDPQIAAEVFADYRQRLEAFSCCIWAS